MDLCHKRCLKHAVGNCVVVVDNCQGGVVLICTYSTGWGVDLYGTAMYRRGKETTECCPQFPLSDVDWTGRLDT